MFENIIGQPSVVETLSREIGEDRLPASILFFGDRLTGKTSTALELARILMCEEHGDWNCRCSACRQNRMLLHPDLQLFGPKDFRSEIYAAAYSLRKAPRLSTLYLFLRAFQKMVRRFDPVLWNGNEPKFKKNAALLQKLDAEMEPFDPHRFDVEAGVVLSEKLLKKMETLVQTGVKLAEQCASDPVSIEQIRRISWFCRTSGTGRKKVVVIHDAHTLLEGARNSLLKILEEPPSGTTFLLLSSNRNAIMPTILSRVRPYRFTQRTTDDQARILTRIFQTGEGTFPDLETFFRDCDPNSDTLRSYAALFLKAMEDADRSLSINETFPLLRGADYFRAFLKICCETLRHGMVDQTGEQPALAALYKQLNDISRQQQLFNQNCLQLLESVYYTQR